MYAVIVTLSHQQQHLRNSAKAMGNVVALPGEIVSISILHKKITLDTGQLDHSVVTRSVKKPEEVDQWSTLFPDQQGEVTCRVARWLSSKYRAIGTCIVWYYYHFYTRQRAKYGTLQLNTGHLSTL